MKNFDNKKYRDSTKKIILHIGTKYPNKNIDPLFMEINWGILFYYY